MPATDTVILLFNCCWCCDPTLLITCDHDIKVLGVAQELHGCIINVHVAELNIRIVLADPDNNLLPQLTDLQQNHIQHTTQMYHTCTIEMKSSAETSKTNTRWSQQLVHSIKQTALADVEGSAQAQT